MIARTPTVHRRDFQDAIEAGIAASEEIGSMTATEANALREVGRTGRLSLTGAFRREFENGVIARCPYSAAGLAVLGTDDRFTRTYDREMRKVAVGVVRIKDTPVRDFLSWAVGR